MAIFSVTTTEYQNLPPSQVGDGSATTDYGVGYIFSIADFTTNTSPVYVDPEGDAASNLKVTVLPSTGTLKLNSINVVLNQIITFSDIGNSLLIFIPDNNTTTQYIDTFEFEIADSGSGQFVG